MGRNNKLELTWVGKEDRPRLEPRILIEDPNLSYAADVRRPDDLFDNRLIQGDNLLALKALEADYTGAVKCVYIDPPFNTKQTFDHYEDGIEHSLWLSLMKERLEILHRLLRRDGSMFIHIDDNELGYLIVLVDEIFGRGNRIGIITFKQSAASGPKAVNPGLVTTNNYILYYAKDKSNWSPARVSVPEERDSRYSKFINHFEKRSDNWQLVPLKEAFTAHLGFADWKEVKKKLGDELEASLTSFVLTHADRVVRTARVAEKDVNESARASLAASAVDRTQVFRSKRAGKSDQFFLAGEQLIFYSAKLREIDGVMSTASPLTNLWDDMLSNNLHAEGNVSFPNGKKPEALLKRCLELSTVKGDIVLDSFAGSGTTGAVAHKMGRRWIMVELRDHAVTHIVPRMRRLVDGEDKCGITPAVGWLGGGGFRFDRLAPSLLVKDRWGNWVISREYNPAMLAEAMCKHLGFAYAPSQDPLEYWRHGHSSERDFLFVTTHALTHDMLAALSYDVGPDRHLLICCKAFSSKQADKFENLTLVRIPQAILATCEWDRNDYSLRIANLPNAALELGETALEPTVKPQRVAKARAAAGPTLFDPSDNEA